MSDPIAIGHRGAPRLATENTLPSIAAAHAAGADWVEVDVKLSRDGTPVILHDTDLVRIWGRHERIDRVALDRLPGRSDGGLERVPTLEEALDYAATTDLTLMVDLPGIPEAEMSCELILLTERITSVVFTGDPAALAYVRARSDHALLALSWESPDLPDPALMESVSPQYFNQIANLVDAHLVDLVHEQGMALCTYTVDEPGAMRALIDAGVDAIISNDIVSLVATVAASRVDGHRARR